jgi:hypothetical protein
VRLEGIEEHETNHETEETESFAKSESKDRLVEEFIFERRISGSTLNETSEYETNTYGSTA